MHVQQNVPQRSNMLVQAPKRIPDWTPVPLPSTNVQSKLRYFNITLDNFENYRKAMKLINNSKDTIFQRYFNTDTLPYPFKSVSHVLSIALYNQIRNLPINNENGHTERIMPANSVELIMIKGGHIENYMTESSGTTREKFYIGGGYTWIVTPQQLLDTYYGAMFTLGNTDYFDFTKVKSIERSFRLSRIDLADNDFRQEEVVAKALYTFLQIGIGLSKKRNGTYSFKNATGQMTTPARLFNHRIQQSV